MTKYFKKRPAFTLIEVIVTLVIAGILAALIIPYMSTSLTQSGVPVSRLKQTYLLEEVMENIIADFENTYKNDPDYLIADFKDRVDSNQDPYYGEYTVVENQLINLDTNVEVNSTDGTGILKITIQNEQGGVLTMLLQPL